MLRLATTRLMGIPTQRGTILPTVFILLGLHLLKPSQIPGIGRKQNLPRHKRGAERTLRVFSVLKSRFATFEVLLVFGTRKPLKNIFACCVILHNMIIKDEKNL